MNIDTRALHHLRKALDEYGPGTPESVLVDYAAVALTAEGRDPDMAAEAAQRAYDKHFKVWGAV